MRHRLGAHTINKGYMASNITSLLNTRESITSPKQLPQLFTRIPNSKQCKSTSTPQSTKSGVRNKLFQQNTFTAKTRMGNPLSNTRLKRRNISLSSRMEIERVASDKLNKKNPGCLLNASPRKPVFFNSAKHSPSLNKGNNRFEPFTTSDVLQQINVELKNLFMNEGSRHLKLAPLNHHERILSIQEKVPQGKERQFINLELASYCGCKVRRLKNKEDIIKPIETNCEEGLNEDVNKVGYNTNQSTGYNITFGPTQFNNAVSKFSS